MKITRRILMYGLVAAQLVVLSVIVASEELNIALDSGVGVDLEILGARAHKDPFRGAYVSGASALDLDGRAVPVPPGLRPGNKVIVAFSVETGRRPRMTRVDRQGLSARPFTTTSFTIPGKVRDLGDKRSFGEPPGSLVARVGDPPISIELALPASIPVDDSALARLTGPGLIRARLHRGFFGHRYLADVRLIGRGWTHDVSFAYDEGRDRLVVLSPREAFDRGPSLTEGTPRSDVFFFDARGKEAGAVEVAGRLVEGVVGPDGHLIALVSDQQWGHSTVSLTRIRDDGQVMQRSVPIPFDRIRGFDQSTGGLWILAGPGSGRPQPPHFVERMVIGGSREPRLGPFASVPHAVVSHGDQVWVVETEQHRVSRLDLASGRTLREYRELNGPTDVAADAGSLYVIEANHTQLTKLSDDGRVLWRIPRFQGLTWVVPDPKIRGGWVGATSLDGRAAGVLRFAADGTTTRVTTPTPSLMRPVWDRDRLGPAAIRAARDGRLYLLQSDVIVVLGADGAPLHRVEGFRFPTEQRLRN